MYFKSVKDEIIFHQELCIQFELNEDVIYLYINRLLLKELLCEYIRMNKIEFARGEIQE